MLKLDIFNQWKINCNRSGKNRNFNYLHYHRNAVCFRQHFILNLLLNSGFHVKSIFQRNNIHFRWSFLFAGYKLKTILKILRCIGFENICCVFDAFEMIFRLLFNSISMVRIYLILRREKMIIRQYLLLIGMHISWKHIIEYDEHFFHLL